MFRKNIEGEAGISWKGKVQKSYTLWWFSPSRLNAQRHFRGKRNWFQLLVLMYGITISYDSQSTFDYTFLQGKLICAVFIFFFKKMVPSQWPMDLEGWKVLISNRKCDVGYANWFAGCSMVWRKKFFSFEKNHDWIESSDHYWVPYGLCKYLIFFLGVVRVSYENFVRNAYILEGWLESFQSFAI